ncbi:MAG: cupin domain-containing protein [Bacteroidota bacterium]
MNIKEYIDSGILYEYCTDTLSASQKAEVEAMCAKFGELRDELAELQRSLEQYSTNTLLTPGAEMQDSIWNVLDNVNKETRGNMDDLPVINRYSEHTNWQRIVKALVPDKIEQGTQIIPLRDAGGVAQMLVLTTEDVPDEVHENERESFIVLEGECECYVGTNVIRLGPGGFIDIPLHEHHNVKVLSPYVIAILQHIAV